MRVGLIAKKVGVGSYFLESKRRECVTFLHVEDCIVVANKNIEKEGYGAVVVASDSVKENRISKSVRGIFKKVGVDYRKKIKEFRVSKENLLEPKTILNVTHFSVGQFIDISSCSIGKGFAGGMKRHGFRGLESTHGVSISHRSHGSTGGCQNPGRVFKNKKMAGQMGNRNVTIQNLKVLDINSEKKSILIKGIVPGHKGCYVFIKDSVKKRFI